MKQGEQLVRKAKNNDAEAFIRLMEENKESMKRVAYAYLKREEDAADAIQDTILDAFEHIHELQKDEYFRTWLTRILINNCAKIYRQNKRQTAYDAEKLAYVQKEGPWENGMEALSDLEFFDLLAHLSEENRMIFQLYFGEQYTVSQIADILRLKENTVKSRLRRGREELRRYV